MLRAVSNKPKGCKVCRRAKACAELDALVDVLKKEGKHVDFSVTHLHRALLLMVPDADVSRTSVQTHMARCRPGWNE